MTSTTLDPHAEFAAACSEVLARNFLAAADRLQRLKAANAHPLAGYWLSAALGGLGDRAGQHAALYEAADLHALAVMEDCDVDLRQLETDPAYALQVADTFYSHRQVGVATAAYRRALIHPAAPMPARLGYGLALQHQGRAEEAAAAFAEAYAVSNRAPAVHSFLLYALFYVEDGVRRHAAAARKWAEAFAGATPPAFANPALEGRKLRIGYSAPAVTSSQARQFIMPVLESHDPETVEVIVYLKDAPNAALPPHVQHRVVGALGDLALARRIREDAIDVLVDLWGHTANGRLSVFALKPAPVQVSWMNYIQTTGLPAMDYVIHPDGMEEAHAQDHFEEKIWRIGPVISPFRPDPRPEPTPTPARAKGFVTFGSYNHPARLSEPTVAAWAAILNRTPGAELVLRYSYFDDSVLQNVTLMRFAAYGVDPNRIVFRGHAAQPAYYESYAEIDIGLDPSPCPGGTTTNDALANGVPVISLKGDDYFARLGSALVSTVGVPHLVADSWDEYVDRAVELASDVAALDALRLQVRLAFDALPERSGPVFTRKLEAAFQAMFQRWREGKASAAA
jgi:protein O-GlcNAc transferase